VPKYEELGYEFCSGLILDDKSIKALSKLTMDERHLKLQEMQMSPNLENELSIAQRQKREVAYIALLNEKIAQIENFEKNKNKDQALALGQKLSPYVDFLGVWRSLNQWFEKKNTNFFIYRYCEVVACKPQEQENALTQLYIHRVFLPPYLRAEIEKSTSGMLKGKEQKALKKMTRLWVPLKIPDSKITSLLEMEWPKLIAFLRSHHLSLFRVAEAAKVQILEGHTIPMDIFQNLTVIPQGLTGDQSKILRGEAFAKYIFSPEESSIVVTSITTKASLVHEYLHSIQSTNNKSYGKALEAGPILQEKFQNREISKDEYEAGITEANAIIWISEHEVYERMQKFSDKMPALEKLNNQEILLRYKKLLGLPLGKNRDQE